MLYIPSPDDCILDVVLIVSPNRQYLGIFDPTTPATIFPEIDNKNTLMSVLDEIIASKFRYQLNTS